jgi:hypothetical protein
MAPQAPPTRKGATRRRWLAENTTPAAADAHFEGFNYGCYGKHKANPYLFNCTPYRGQDSDRSLCDKHAGFGFADMARLKSLVLRAKAAALFGNLTWAVDDNGWIYEMQITNAAQNQWHGYPMLTNDPFAAQVWRRFDAWAQAHGSYADRRAAQSCSMMYGVKV